MDKPFFPPEIPQVGQRVVVNTNYNAFAETTVVGRRRDSRGVFSIKLAADVLNGCSEIVSPGPGRWELIMGVSNTPVEVTVLP